MQIEKCKLQSEGCSHQHNLHFAICNFHFAIFLLEIGHEDNRFVDLRDRALQRWGGMPG